jgi:hypothetical protein
MSKSVVVHASCVAIGARGVLLLGESSAGKSDLALRLIDQGARLVADDRTVVTRGRAGLTAAAPTTIAGMIEVRGLGIVALPAGKVKLALAVMLGHEGDRLPEPATWHPHGLAGAPGLPLIALHGRHASDPAKIRLALKAFAKGLFRDTFRTT